MLAGEEEPTLGPIGSLPSRSMEDGKRHSFGRVGAVDSAASGA